MPLHIPTGIQQPTTTEPRNVLIYSQPKVGKTETVAALGQSPAGLLHLDTEDGTAFVATRRVHIRNRAEWNELDKALLAAWRTAPFRFLVVDNIDKVEEWALELADETYRRFPMGKTFGGQSVLELDRGAGYGYLRNAFELLLKPVIARTEWNTIFIAHARAKYLDGKPGTDAESDEVDLTGKVRKLMCGKVDAIGRAFRDVTGKLKISFATKDLINCGIRGKHLRGKVIEFGYPPRAEEWKQVWPETWDKVPVVPTPAATATPVPAPVAAPASVPAAAPATKAA